MRLNNDTAQGYMETDSPGDGVVLNFIKTARGRIQYGKSPTLQTDGGGEFGGHHYD